MENNNILKSKEMLKRASQREMYNMLKICLYTVKTGEEITEMVEAYKVSYQSNRWLSMLKHESIKLPNMDGSIRKCVATKEAITLQLLNENRFGVMLSGLFVKHNKNGVKVFYSLKDAPIGSLHYKFYNCSASGLATNNFIFMLAGKVGKENDNKTVIVNDNRWERLNLVSSNAFSSLQKLGKVFSMVDIKKMLNRTGNGNAGQSALTNIKNFIIFEEYAGGLMDGWIAHSSDVLERCVESAGMNIPKHKLVGTFSQDRTGNCKAGSSCFKRSTLAHIARELIATGTKIKVLVVDGKAYKKNSINAELIEKCLANIEMIADTNAAKLEWDYENTKVWHMGVKKPSKATLSTQIVEKMMLEDCKGTKALLMEDFKNQFAAEVSDALGVNNTPGIADEDYIVNYISKTIPEAKQFDPSIWFSMYTNLIKRFGNIIQKMHTDIDGEFRPIVADFGVLFSIKILEENEVFIANSDVDEIFAMRYPSMHFSEGRCYKVISTEELKARINAKVESGLISKNTGKELLGMYLSQKGTIIVPASKRIMNLHGGHDFDTDTWVVIKDKRYIAIFRKLPKIAVCIKREKVVDDVIDVESQNVISNVFGTIDRHEVDLNNLAVSALSMVNSKQDSVGYVSNNNTINMILLNVLINGTCDQKQRVVEYFIRKYGSGAEGYVTEYKYDYSNEWSIDVWEKEADKIENKFRTSIKTVESCIKFLRDVAFLYRFYQESAIDAPKKDYRFTTKFTHRDINLAGFYSKVEIEEVSGIQKELVLVNKFSKRSDNNDIIIDSLGELRDEMVHHVNTVMNNLLAAAIKHFDHNTLEERYGEMQAKCSSSKYAGTLRILKDMYDDLSTSVIMAKIDTDNEAEVAERKRLLKEKYDIIGSTAKILTKDASPEEIGMLASYVSVSNKDSLVPWTNKFASKVCQDEYLAFLEDKFNSPFKGKVGTKVISATCNNKDADISNLEGVEVVVDNGFAIANTNDNCNWKIVTKTIRDNLTGTLSVIDGDLYVVRDRIKSEVELGKFAVKVIKTFKPLTYKVEDNKEGLIKLMDHAMVVGFEFYKSAYYKEDGTLGRRVTSSINPSKVIWNAIVAVQVNKQGIEKRAIVGTFLADGGKRSLISEKVNGLFVRSEDLDMTYFTTKKDDKLILSFDLPADRL